MLRRYVTAVVGRPKLVVASVILITLVLGFFITRIRMLLDVDSQIPPGHPLVIVGKKIVKLLKDSKVKAQASIQGDAVRVSSAKKDTLQDTIALVRKSITDFPLQFKNFRD